MGDPGEPGSPSEELLRMAHGAEPISDLLSSPERANLFSEIEDWVYRMSITEAREKKGFFESEEFNRSLEIIRQCGEIEQESLLYGTRKIDGLTHEVFQRVVESVLFVRESELMKSEESTRELPTYYLDYKGIRFCLSLGQGSHYKVQVLKQKTS